MLAQNLDWNVGQPDFKLISSAMEILRGKKEN